MKGQLAGAPSETAHPVTGVEEVRDQPPSDVSGGSGDQDSHGRARLEEIGGYGPGGVSPAEALPQAD
jgi:hypothetical protein